MQFYWNVEERSIEQGPALLNAQSPQEEQVMGLRSKWPSVADLRARKLHTYL